MTDRIIITHVCEDEEPDFEKESSLSCDTACLTEAQEQISQDTAEFISRMPDHLIKEVIQEAEKYSCSGYILL